MCSLALAIAASLPSLGVRAWYEHVPSKDNPADVLSRAGLADPQVAEKLANGTLKTEPLSHVVSLFEEEQQDLKTPEPARQYLLWYSFFPLDDSQEY